MTQKEKEETIAEIKLTIIQADDPARTIFDDHIDGNVERISKLATENSALKKRVEELSELIERLKSQAGHDGSCPVWKHGLEMEDTDCTCDFKAVMADVELNRPDMDKVAIRQHLAAAIEALRPFAMLLSSTEEVFAGCDIFKPHSTLPVTVSQCRAAQKVIQDFEGRQG